MKLEIKRGRAEGEIKAPPSKSMAHRSLICGAFSKRSEINGVQLSKDIEATLRCLEALGAMVSVCGDKIVIGGLRADKKPANAQLFCNESGSTLRFMLPICLLFESEITLSGSSRLFERSLDAYTRICKENGLFMELSENSVTVKGPLKSGAYKVRGDISSQFLSGLLMALPNCRGESIITLEGEMESRSYVDLTLNALAASGVNVSCPDSKTFVICGGDEPCSKCETVEGDYSNAAFFDAMKALGHNVSVLGLNEHSAQGDRVYKELFAKIENKEFPIDISDCPDLAPILFAFAAVKGRGEFVGTRRLKYKESNRALAMKEELRKFGAEVSIGENTVVVSSSGLAAPGEELCGHNDHRIVMSLAVLCTLTGGVINGSEAVAKSFPDFFEKLMSLGIEVEKK